jgi:hypothetical protein
MAGWDSIGLEARTEALLQVPGASQVKSILQLQVMWPIHSLPRLADTDQGPVVVEALNPYHSGIMDETTEP